MPKGKKKLRGGFDAWVIKMNHANKKVLTKGKPEDLPPLQPLEFSLALQKALCRAAAFLNVSSSASFANHADLRGDDDALYQKIDDSTWPTANFMNLMYVSSPSTANEMLPYDLASNFFYGNLDVSIAPGVTHRRLNWTITDSFLTHGYKGVHLPEYSNDEINPKGVPPNTLAVMCCTNYFVRNLWHNYVHTVHHNVNQSNYRQFAGTSRHAMDFEADNLSNILTAASYGFSLTADNTTNGHSDADLVRLFRRNRSNDLFSLRALTRNERQPQTDELAYLDEAEWRYARSICGYVSSWLVCSGVAAADVKVHHRGGLSGTGGKLRRTEEGLVVSVNGVQIPVSGASAADAQILDYNDRRKQLKSIAGRVEAAYKERLRADPALVAFARNSFNGILHRLSPPLS